jgi:hypothetical protein
MINTLKHWHPNTPASEAAIRQLISESRSQLPEAYLGLLRVSNGGYAGFSVSPWTINFWSVENILRLNHEYGVDKGAPNFLAFGDNLGEEVVAFDKREGARSGVYLIPWHAPSEVDALKVANDFKILIDTLRDSDQI